ncbi:PD-(D/E)XK nuclease family transposase [Clostridiaceae bacterium UIB06]|uniref:PD-(D/E)XK nuclease family transposase n=1 Tax=Clostridium thailandense TaxID=2794346 RepID=A0A949TK76_9CLOT|nr:Rpn family recombination-promoting nuclease/putative transposase [Clostridium thailandense]MBV7273825.1 PD-(D/E)XK nuclease family transposase [Clostridium thailandense]MCH5136910.1 PD-(D/E)XK nuclease family transposase [Clostridiaceae bacterium UIB06]
MCRINPKVDFAFKKLFGSPENKDILISFINSIIREEEKIKDIELKNPYNIANYRNGKMTILDIKAVDEKGTWYDIEMQLAEQGYYDKRAFYYWAKVYSEQIESGNDFELLRKTIAINILDFNYLDEEDFHNVYRVYNEKSNKELSNLFEMHFIELGKFKKNFKELNNTLDRWISFLNRAYELDSDRIPEELAKDEIVRKAIEKLEIMYLDKEERELYENDLKRLRDYKAALRTAEEKGIERGIEKGKIDIAKNLLDVLDEETIAIKTGLSVDFIRDLKIKQE